jgi:hypothetical protein
VVRWPVLPFEDVPQVVAGGAHEKIVVAGRQSRVHVADEGTVTFWTLCSGGHEITLEGALVIPSEHRA